MFSAAPGSFMWTAVGLLLLAWIAALLLSLTFGGWIALLPVAALVLAVIGLAAELKGRRRTAEPDEPRSDIN